MIHIAFYKYKAVGTLASYSGGAWPSPVSSYPGPLTAANAATTGGWGWELGTDLVTEPALKTRGKDFQL